MSKGSLRNNVDKIAAGFLSTDDAAKRSNATCLASFDKEVWRQKDKARCPDYFVTNPKVKICGLSRAEDIDAVNRAMPDFIGFVFAPSRRQVNFDIAARLKVRLNASIKTVGVFVNGHVETIIAMYKCGLIDMAQLHGDEDNEYIKRLKDSCSCPVIKAVSVKDSLPVIPPEYGCLIDYLLFDTIPTSSTAHRGGAGKAFDWNILKGFTGKPYFLAGGLGAANVSDAITLLSPFCVDTSSGVETDGKKDSEKILEFVRMVRGCNGC